MPEREPEVNIVTSPGARIQPPDGGWGWIVCFAVFMTNFTISGVINTNGIILLGLIDIFNESVSKTSLVGSIISGISMFGGPLVLVLNICKADYRQIIMRGAIIAAVSTATSMFAPSVEILILTYGILAGFSLAICFFAANVILGYYFNKKRALAVGIANSGSSCGSFLMSYLVEKSISFYGTRGTFLLFGGVFLNLTVYGALCRPLKPNIKTSHYISENRRTFENQTEEVTQLVFTQEYENTKSASSRRYSIDEIEPMPQMLQMSSLSVCSKEMPNNLAKLRSCYCNITIFRNKNFVLLLIIFSLSAVGNSLLIYLPAYTESLGMSREEAAMIMSIYGIVATLSQILTGLLVDVVHIPISCLLFSTVFGMSLSILTIPFCQTFTTLALSTTVFAIGFSSGFSLRMIMIAAVLGIEKISEAYSIASVLVGIGYIVYPILGGLLYDATRSFAVIFYTNSVIAFVAAIFSCGIIYAQKKGNLIHKQ